MAAALSTWLLANREATQALLESAYGIKGTIHLLAGEYDLNFRVECGEQCYLLKVMRRDCDAALVDMQCRALEALAAQRPDLPLQRLIRTRNGAATATLADDDGYERLAWLLSYLPGRVMAEIRPHTPALLEQIGATLGQIDAALLGFRHPACERELKWDLRRAGWIRASCDAIEGAGRRALVARIADRFTDEISPRLKGVRRGVIHGDANDYNLLVAYEGGATSGDGRGGQRLTGLLDFGDMSRTALVSEPAIAAAYAMMGKADPFAAAEAVVAGYHRAFPLQDEELALVFPLILTRLAVSVTNAALAKRERPDDPYVTISEAPAWRLLEQLHDYDPRFAEARLRSACGLDPWPKSTRVLAWLRERRGSFAEVLGPELPTAEGVTLDLSFSSTAGGDDPEQFDADVCGARVDAILRAARTDLPPNPLPAREGALQIPPRPAGAEGQGGEAHLPPNPLLAREGAPLPPLLAGEGGRGVRSGIGRYGEPRPINAGPAFGAGGDPLAVRRTRHIAVDLFAPVGTPVHAPLAGQIVQARWVPERFDYGGLVVLRHCTDAGDTFDVLYGHLARASVEALQAGQRVAAGEAFAILGDRHENGDWPPHVHVQLLVEDVSKPGDTPQGSVAPGEYPARSALSPCPAALLNLLDERVRWDAPSAVALQARRTARTAANVRISYAEPFHPVRAWRHLLYDAEGRSYLDAYNNVPHVGHCHPRVVEAATGQMRLLSTNTRYLYDSWLDYADRLVARLPAPLSVCFFLNSGSEANELALRLARAHTGAKDMLVMDHAYHGNTTGAMDISPYKFSRPGGPGAPDWVHVTALPDVYRGPFRVNDHEAANGNVTPALAPERSAGASVARGVVCPEAISRDAEGEARQTDAKAAEREAGAKYAALVRDKIESVLGSGRRLAGYISECLPSVGGQIVLPEGFLSAVYRDVRRAGGVCIADDVQTALGRVGSHFWGFELQGVVPDILVLGKPLGNGHPLAAVVTTPEIASSFAAGPEFFSTFGGNSVSCAVGAAVLDVLEEEQLQANAAHTGALLLSGLAELARRHPLIGDVRGTGLFIGIELVTDRVTREPASRQASYVKNRMRERRILLGTEGPADNVLKIRPPMTFDAAAAGRLLETLDEVLREDLAQPTGTA